MAFSKQVLIIRHGEKYGVPDPAPDAYAHASEISESDEIEDAAELAEGGDRAEGVQHLSIRGSARAMALPSLFAEAGWQSSCKLEFPQGIVRARYMEARESGIRPRFCRPDKIFATRRSRASNRPFETVAPLAAYLKLSVDDRFSNNTNDVEKLADEVKKCQEKIVLICWHHGKIPSIAEKFGIKNPPKWPGSVFDRVWQITWTKGGALLEDLPQRLLFGDSLI